MTTKLFDYNYFHCWDWDAFCELALALFLTLTLTLQFLEQEGLAAAPLGVQAHADGRLHGGLAQDVRQGAAVEVIAQHVPI